MKKIICTFLTFLFTNSYAVCINQNDYTSNIELIDNNKQVLFNIKRKNNDFFKILKSVKNKKIEITGFYFPNNKNITDLPEFNNPIDLNTNEMISAFYRKGVIRLFVSKNSKRYLSDIVYPVEWDYVKEVKIKESINNLSVLDIKLDKEDVIFYIVLIQGNQGECAYFESSIKKYDFKNKRIIK